MSAERRNEERKKNVKKRKNADIPPDYADDDDALLRTLKFSDFFMKTFPFSHLDSAAMLCRTIKTITNQIYRQLNSTLPLFLRRSPRCFRVRPAEALHAVEEFSQLRRRLNARHDAEPQLRRRFNSLMTSI